MSGRRQRTMVSRSSAAGKRHPSAAAGGHGVTRGRAVSYVLMAVAVAVALTVGVVDADEARTTEERTLDVAATIRCPQCRGQSAEQSDTASAQAVRREIAERIDDGQSDDEIRSYFASTYGEEILLTPPATGVGSLVWIVPVVAFAVSGAGLALAFRRWQDWT